LTVIVQVPILKFFDRAGGLEVDLSVNNPTSIRNTHLMFCYSQADYRVRPLVLAVKLWAKEHGINEARQAGAGCVLSLTGLLCRFQTLSSYSLTLMVLHYLQSGVFPAVLPCLQEQLPAVFNANVSLAKILRMLTTIHQQSVIFKLPYEQPPWVSRNRQVCMPLNHVCYGGA
jgi:poly(A) RNA polymerase GLD2